MKLNLQSLLRSGNTSSEVAPCWEANSSYLCRFAELTSKPACAESSSSRCCDCSWVAAAGLVETLGLRSVIAAFSMERGLAKNDEEDALGVHAGVLQGLPTSRSTSKYPGAPALNFLYGEIV